MTRVLIVDDQPSFRRSLRQLLTEAGLKVVGEAESIPAAKRIVQKLMPDIAVVDVMLPGESGIEGTPQLKELVATLQVILVSAHYDSDQMLQKSAEEAGATIFIPKDELELEIVKKWKKSDHEPFE